MADWSQLLWPSVGAALPVSAAQLMMVVGVVEILAGLLLMELTLARLATVVPAGSGRPR